MSTGSNEQLEETSLNDRSGHSTGSAKYLGPLYGSDNDDQLSLLRSESQDDSTCGGGDSGSEDCLSDSEGHHKRPKTPRDRRLEAYDELTDVQVSCLNFAMEHRIFLKAILGLLAERDKKATEIGMNDPNTLKSGPLKKASGVGVGWKVKFVEVRRGMFSYYEDTVSGDKSTASLLRKNLPLDATTCSCRPVKIHRNGLK